MSPQQFVVPALDADGLPMEDDHGDLDDTGNLDALLSEAQLVTDMGSWQLDLATATTQWSAGMYRILGIAADSSPRTSEAVLAFVHPQDRGRIGALITAVVVNPDALAADREPVEFRVVRADGAVRSVRAHGTVQRDAAGRPERWIGAVHDITELRLRERELQARHRVSEVLGAWDSCEAGCLNLLGHIGGALGYDMGALWHWDDASGAVVCASFWSRPGIDPEPFASAVKTQRFRLGDGRLGRTWVTQELSVASDVAIDPVFRPRDVAVRQGLRSALAFPAVGENGVPVAILSFYSFDRREPTPSLRRTFRGIGREVGTFLARRRAHLGPRPISDRELEVLCLAADGHTGPAIAKRLVVAPSTVKTHFNNIYAKLGVSDRAAAVAVALRTGLIQ
jgi:PAS domain S-box-containing protein